MPEVVGDNMVAQDAMEEADQSEQFAASQADNNRDPIPSANTKKRQDRDKMINLHIGDVQASGSTTLELNNVELSIIPEPLLRCKHVQVNAYQFEWFV